MTIYDDDLYLVILNIGSAQVGVTSGSRLKDEAQFQSRKHGKWSVSTNLPKWVIDAGYEKVPSGGGMCFIIRPIKVSPKLTWDQALTHGLAGAKLLARHVKLLK